MAILHPPARRKPQRWGLTRLRDDRIAAFPFLEASQRQFNLRRDGVPAVPSGSDVEFDASGRLGPCVAVVGSTSGVAFADTAGDFRWQPSALPLAVEVVFEISEDPTAEVTLFGNAPGSLHYRGFWLGIQTSLAGFALRLGEGDGSTGLDGLRLFETSDTIELDTIYHVIAVAHSLTEASIYVNGVAQTLTPSGTGDHFGYGSGPGDAALATELFINTAQFLGKFYLLNLYGRSIFDAEARVRAQDPWRELRQGQLMRSSEQMFSAFTKPLMSQFPWRRL